jgi:hypothetical protein
MFSTEVSRKRQRKCRGEEWKLEFVLRRGRAIDVVGGKQGR